MSSSEIFPASSSRAAFTSGWSAIVGRRIMGTASYGGNQAVCSVARDQVDLLVFQGASEQPQIHDLRRSGKTQAVRGDESFIAVGTLHEFITESGAPLRRVSCGLRDSL